MRDVNVKFRLKPKSQLKTMLERFDMRQASIVSKICKSLHMPWQPVLLGVDSDENRYALVMIVKDLWWSGKYERPEICKLLGRTNDIVMAAMFACTSRKKMGVDGRWQFQKSSKVDSDAFR